MIGCKYLAVEWCRVRREVARKMIGWTKVMRGDFVLFVTHGILVLHLTNRPPIVVECICRNR